MKICPKCKMKHSSEDNFCWVDGSKLKKYSFQKCPHCGKHKIGKYCSGCGIKFHTQKKNKEKI